MIAAPLNDGIALLQLDLLGVEHERDASFQHQAKIQRRGFLHIRVRRAGRIGGSFGRAGGREIGSDLLGTNLVFEHAVWGEGHDTAERSVGRRLDFAVGLGQSDAGTEIVAAVVGPNLAGFETGPRWVAPDVGNRQRRDRYPKYEAADLNSGAGRRAIAKFW